MSSLDELAVQYNTDKSSAQHDYCRLYEALFAPLRYEHMTLLELGVWKGGSIRLWRDYFPDAVIVGVDNFSWVDNYWHSDPRPDLTALRDVHIFECNQDAMGLPDLLGDHCPLTIVIDDCSHHPETTLASFGLLRKCLAPGGFYIIEDVDAEFGERLTRSGFVLHRSKKHGFHVAVRV